MAAKTTNVKTTEEQAETLVKVRVLITFRDKNTRQIHKKGEVLEVTASRLAELTASRQFVKAVR